MKPGALEQECRAAVRNSEWGALRTLALQCKTHRRSSVRAFLHGVNLRLFDRYITGDVWQVVISYGDSDTHVLFIQTVYGRTI